MYTTEIIQGIAALYLLFISTAMETKNLRSTVIFKFSPAVMAFLLGLSVFKVI